MKMHVVNVGPIKDGYIELGDLTLFLGRPNTGKSYALRLLYYSLAVLDEVAARPYRRILGAKLAKLLEKRGVLEDAKHFAERLARAAAALYILADKGYVIDHRVLQYIARKLDAMVENNAIKIVSRVRLLASIEGEELASMVRELAVKQARETVALVANPASSSNLWAF